MESKLIVWEVVWKHERSHQKQMMDSMILLCNCKQAHWYIICVVFFWFFLPFLWVRVMFADFLEKGKWPKKDRLTVSWEVRGQERQSRIWQYVHWCHRWIRVKAVHYFLDLLGEDKSRRQWVHEANMETNIGRGFDAHTNLDILPHLRQSLCQLKAICCCKFKYPQMHINEWLKLMVTCFKFHSAHIGELYYNTNCLI